MNTKQLVLVAVMLIATGSLPAEGKGLAGDAEGAENGKKNLFSGEKAGAAKRGRVGLGGGG